MRIIKAGLMSPTWTAEVTCAGDDGCMALFEVQQDDLFLKPQHGPHKDAERACCACPECGAPVDVPRAAWFFADLPTLREWKGTHPEAAAAQERNEAAAQASKQASARAYGPHIV